MSWKGLAMAILLQPQFLHAGREGPLGYQSPSSHSWIPYCLLAAELASMPSQLQDCEPRIDP